jgi:hypothetical protein
MSPNPEQPLVFQREFYEGIHASTAKYSLLLGRPAKYQLAE